MNFRNFLSNGHAGSVHPSPEITKAKRNILVKIHNLLLYLDQEDKVKMSAYFSMTAIAEANFKFMQDTPAYWKEERINQAFDSMKKTVNGLDLSGLTLTGPDGKYLHAYRTLKKLLNSI